MRLTKNAQVIGGWVWEHFSRIADKVSKEHLGRDAVVKSGYNGNYPTDSPHLRGEAWLLYVGVDPFNLNQGRYSNAVCEDYAAKLQYMLGDAYQVDLIYDNQELYVKHIKVALDLV